MLVIQLCPTLCDPFDYSPPGSSVHGILQARYWSELPFPAAGHLPDPEIKPVSPALAGRFFTTEPPGKPSSIAYLSPKSHFLFLFILKNSFNEVCLFTLKVLL